MFTLSTRGGLPSRGEFLYWTYQTLRVLWKISYGVVIVLLLAATVIMSLVLAGLAHFSDEKRNSVLRDVRDQMLKFLVNFVIGINSLIDGHHNEAFLDHTTLGSQAKLMIKQGSDEEQFLYSRNVFTASTPTKTGNQQDLTNANGDLVGEGENLSLVGLAQNEVAALSYQSFKASKAEKFRNRRLSLEEYVKPEQKTEDTA